MDIDREHLPQDPGLLQEMVAGLLNELVAKDRKLLRLQHQLEKLLRWRYGPKREKIEPNQMFLFAAALVETNQDLAAAKVETAQKKPRSGSHGRGRLPQHLRRQRVVYDLEPQERTCPQCQAQLQHIGEEISERLEYIPASLYVIQEACQK